MQLTLARAMTSKPSQYDEDERSHLRPALAAVVGAPGEGVETSEEERRRRKELKRLEDAHRPLDAWERYRALNDAMDEAYELIDIANREARFALILMGALNAVLFVVGTRTELVQAIPASARPWIAVAFLIYACVAVYFLIQAIETLRPRRYRPEVPQPDPAALEDHPVGVRYYEDVLRRDVESHCGAWRDVRISQLNAELAVQLHSLALKNRAKHLALRRLYAGLRLMTFIVAGLLMLLVLLTFNAQRANGVGPLSMFISRPAQTAAANP